MTPSPTSIQYQWEYANRYAPAATQSEAHAEWHRNAGVPMGQPGCPQDACHPPDDFEEPTVKCGNKAAHPEGGVFAYHYSAAEVRECYAGTGRFATADKPSYTERLAEEVKVVESGETYSGLAALAARITKVEQAVGVAKAPEVEPEGLLKVDVLPPRQSVDTREQPDYAAWATIPVEADDYAHYALVNKGGAVSFYRVRRPSTGDHKGKTYVDLEVSDAVQKMPWGQTISVLNRIAADPMAAAVLYGQTTKRCAICHRKLTNEASRERGIGPKCAAKMEG